uniref:CUB domain-containing protein n=1 Tax=Plectus sambesii TaxID=2011161 RepID=A0A914WW37_9BILA
MAVIAASLLLVVAFGSVALGDRCSCSNRVVLLMNDNDYQFVSSPDYPRPYCPDLDCVWRVAAPDNDSHIQFYSSNLDLHPEDSIAIFDGKQEEELNASLTCKKNEVCDFVSAGQYLTIEFISGSTDSNHVGFRGAVMVLSDYQLETKTWVYVGGLVLIVFIATLAAGALILCLLRRRTSSRTPRSKNNDPLL